MEYNRPMGNDNQKPKVEHSILTEFHKSYSKLYSEVSNDSILNINSLLKVFPKRTIFCKSLLEWMPILSYKKTANKESFIFACEILSLEGEEIISTVYKNHSYVFIETFFHMTLHKLPKEISDISYSELINFAQTFTNFFFTDDQDMVDLTNKVIDLIRLQSEIEKEPVNFNSVIKSTH